MVAALAVLPVVIVEQVAVGGVYRPSSWGIVGAQNPLRATPCGFESHSRHQRSETPPDVSESPIIPGQQPILTIPYAPIYSEDTGNDDKEFTE